MIPYRGPPKPAARKSSFPEHPNNKRRRLPGSPLPEFMNRCIGISSMNMVTRQPSEAREVPVDVTHAPTATLEVAYQPAGPETEADKLLGYPLRHAEHKPPGIQGPPLLPRAYCSRENSRQAEDRESAQTELAPSPAGSCSPQDRYGSLPVPGVHERSSVISNRLLSTQGESTRASPQIPCSSPSRPFVIPREELAIQVVDFEDLAAHTAKCDVCDKRNTDGMWRCKPCGWQCCRRCLAERCGDRSHPKAGNLHVPRDMVKKISSGYAAADPFRPVSSASQPDQSSHESTSAPTVTTDEQAARLLNIMRSDNWERRERMPMRMLNNAAAPAPIQRAVEANRQRTDKRMEVPSEIGQDGTVDLENLPDHLVNVRRNPSRRARPADMKE
ncbi:hypothetical protein POX_a01084 [Penicillium oxalicum]|uniref:hypothetical protein n=1 Tax=Penicillium oxalicum TaxID=69781 RepID=UPI0020B8A990|nr:hypothetical protein POX_a01084 [Penicillium oxalicum]KAI2794485.1 hypothetical protein POX_a01084 [Penicillium oxalicum]